jgi:hypothetical protein
MNSKKPDNDNVPAKLWGSTALAAETFANALNGVDLSGHRRSGLPMLLFKARMNEGIWVYGPKKTKTEDGARWAVNPMSFEWGFVCLAGDKFLGEQMAPVTQAKPDATKLPD